MAAQERPELNAAGKAALLFYAVFTAYSSVALVPILPRITEYFHATPNADVLARTLLSLTGVVLAIGAPITGLLANKLGWRRMLIAGAVLFTVAGVAGAFVNDLYSLLASRAVFAVGVAIFGTLMLALLTIEFEGDRRNRWLGMSMFIGTCSSVLFVLLSGFLGSLDWRYSFLVHGAGVLLIALIVVGVREPNIAQSGPAHAVGGKLPWGLLAIATVVGIVIGGPTLFIPFHLAEIGIKDPSLMSLALVSSVFAGAVAAAFFGRLRRLLSARATFMLGLALVGIGLGIIGLAQGFTMAVLGGLVNGLGIGSCTPNLFAYAASVSSEADRARNMGLARGMYMAAPMLAQLGLEAVSKAQGAGGAIVVLAAIGLVGGAALRLFAIEPRPLTAVASARPAN